VVTGIFGIVVLLEGGTLDGARYERVAGDSRCRETDMQFSVNLLVESGDLVVSNWTLTGTHSGGPFYDVSPSGEPVTINGTAILRLRDGKVVGHWGGPHCAYGIGLSPARTPHARSAAA
jgi:predicted ester cyclase